MVTHKQSFELNKDIDIYGTIYDVSSAVAVLILVHDFLEHRFLYQDIIKAFNEQQIVVISYDLRGHHNSLEKELSGHFKADDLKDDLIDVIKMSQQEYPNLPLTLMGGKLSGWLINSILHDIEVSNIIIADINIEPKFIKLRQLISSFLPKRWKSVFVKESLIENQEDDKDPFIGKNLTNQGYQAICELMLTPPQSVEYPVSILVMCQNIRRELVEKRRDYYHACNIYDIHVLFDENASFDKLVSFIIH